MESWGAIQRLLVAFYQLGMPTSYRCADDVCEWSVAVFVLVILAAKFLLVLYVFAFIVRLALIPRNHQIRDLLVGIVSLPAIMIAAAFIHLEWQVAALGKGPGLLVPAISGVSFVVMPLWILALPFLIFPFTYYWSIYRFRRYKFYRVGNLGEAVRLNHLYLSDQYTGCFTSAVFFDNKNRWTGNAATWPLLAVLRYVFQAFAFIGSLAPRFDGTVSPSRFDPLGLVPPYFRLGPEGRKALRQAADKLKAYDTGHAQIILYAMNDRDRASDYSTREVVRIYRGAEVARLLRKELARWQIEVLVIPYFLEDDTCFAPEPTGFPADRMPVVGHVSGIGRLTVHAREPQARAVVFELIAIKALSVTI